jgi:hypothetical protein
MGSSMDNPGQSRYPPVSATASQAKSLPFWVPALRAICDREMTERSNEMGMSRQVTNPTTLVFQSRGRDSPFGNLETALEDAGDFLVSISRSRFPFW